MLKILILPLIYFLSIIQYSADPVTEVDAYWKSVSQTVQEGDFQGYSALYHEDAVLVNGLSETSYPIADALSGWKQGFDDTKAGKLSASVQFRFSKRLHSETTAHDTGIFRYTSQVQGEEAQTFLANFQGLLVKKDGEWLMMMEYQISEATQEEWDALE